MFLCQMCDINGTNRGGIPWPKTGATQYYAQLGFPDKGRAIKGLLVSNSWDLEPWDLLTGLALGQPSPKV